MKDNKNKVSKVCGFYMDKWHLTMMILPNIAKEVENKNKVITILQNGIKSNIEEMLSKMNLNKELENEILNINWTKTNPIKYSDIKEELENTVAQNVNIIVDGDEFFIEQANKIIKRVVSEENFKSKITQINCYDLTKFNNVKEIENKHEFIIRTSGMIETDKSINNLA